jgi:GPR1/FUN34/yaaH family protein
MDGFATSLITVSFGMVSFLGVTDQTINIGSLCFVACVGLLVSAQWEMVRGITFSYTVLSAYGTSMSLPLPSNSLRETFRLVLWRLWCLDASDTEHCRTVRGFRHATLQQRIWLLHLE